MDILLLCCTYCTYTSPIAKCSAHEQSLLCSAIIFDHSLAFENISTKKNPKEQYYLSSLKKYKYEVRLIGFQSYQPFPHYDQWLQHLKVGRQP